MYEIGGYFELDNNYGQEYYPYAWALNSARGALRVVLEQRGYRKLYLPAFLCESVERYCKKIGIELEQYEIGTDLKPEFNRDMLPHETMLIVNYYGQTTNNEIAEYKTRWGNIVMDNVQAFFQQPVEGVDTIYSCRKFFGVPDGAYLASDLEYTELERDVSFQKMRHILGRYERTASEHYVSFKNNDQLLGDQPPRAMSKLTHNLLRALDYSRIKKKRDDNFAYLHYRLAPVNQLKISRTAGPFAYPLLIPNGAAIRKELHKVRIYVPTLWPNVLQEQKKTSLAFRLAADILPLPCDQRYGEEEMNYMIEKIYNIHATIS